MRPAQLYCYATSIGLSVVSMLLMASCAASGSAVAEAVRRITADGVVTQEETQELVNLAGGSGVLPPWVNVVGTTLAAILAAFAGQRWGKAAAVQELGPQIARAHARLDKAERAVV